MNFNFNKRFFISTFMSFLLAMGVAEPITNVSRSPQWESWAPRVAVDTRGNIHVVWLELYSAQSGDIYYSYFDYAARTWSSPINLSSSGNVFSESLWCADVATDAANRVYVVWIEGNIIKLRIKDGTWGGEFVVNSGGVNYESPRLGVSLEGDIYIIWWSHDGLVWSRARVGGLWEETKLISLSSSRSKFPDITVGRNIVAACWMQREAGEYWYQIAYSQRARARNAPWTKPQVISSSNDDQQHGVIELDPTDRAHVVWTSELVTAARQVFYSSGSIKGFTAAKSISSVDNIHYPSIAEAAGNLYVSWQVGAYGDGLGLFYNAYIGDSWIGEKYLSGSTGATYCDVAMSQDGSGIYFVWDSRGEVFIVALGVTPPDNKPPIAKFTCFPETGKSPLTVTFDASLSYDPDGFIVDYDWDFGDGSQGKGVVVSHTYYQPGIYIVRLTVTDNRGSKGMDIKIIEVIKPNIPPVADFTFSPQTGLFPLEVTFDASASYDPDGFIVRYEWSFGDGGTGSGQIVKHCYQTWGTFTVRLTVYDEDGASDTKTASLEVLRLFQPLNIRWETHLDEGLFLTRYVTDIRWDKNPKNDEVVAKTKIPLAAYRIYRKRKEEDDRAFRFIAEVNANTYFYRDSNVGGIDRFVYTVTVRDAAGHESPLYSGDNFSIPVFIEPTNLKEKRQKDYFYLNKADRSN